MRRRVDDLTRRPGVEAIKYTSQVRERCGGVCGYPLSVLFYMDNGDAAQRDVTRQKP